MGNYPLDMACGKSTKVLYALVFSLFAIYLVLQHQLVFPYHDDWGYAVLTYVGEVTGFEGQDFTQGQLITFLHDEYLRWSGRFFGFFIQINLFKLGIEYVRLAQVAVLLTIVYFTLRLTVGRLLHPVIVVPVLYFCSLPVFVVTDGLYWFSASIAYVWGVAPLLAGACLIHRRDRLDLSSSLLLACAALFHEQMAFAVLAFVFAYFLLNFLLKRSIKELLPQAIFTLPIIAAACLVVLAPGNFQRKSVSTYPTDSMLDNAVINLHGIGELLLDMSEASIVLAWLGISFVIYLSLVLRQLNMKGAWKLSVGAAGLLVLAIFYATASLVFMLFTAALYAGMLLFLHIKKGTSIAVLCLYLSAIASLLLLLIAPGISGRTFLTFYFLMIAPVTYAFSEMGREWKFPVTILIALAVLPFSVINARTVYLGYADNYAANAVNDYKLRALSYDIKHENAEADSILLYKLEDERYAATMPYERPLIEKWIKRYYALPESLELDWQ